MYPIHHQRESLIKCLGMYSDFCAECQAFFGIVFWGSTSLSLLMQSGPEETPISLRRRPRLRIVTSVSRQAALRRAGTDFARGALSLETSSDPRHRN